MQKSDVQQEIADYIRCNYTNIEISGEKIEPFGPDLQIVVTIQQSDRCYKGAGLYDIVFVVTGDIAYPLLGTAMVSVISNDECSPSVDQIESVCVRKKYNP